MKIGVIAAGVGTSTTINLTYLPSVISFRTATVPTALKVNILGEGVNTDLDGNGINSTSRMFRVGVNETNGFVVPLANGIVKGKNVEITITNATAVAIDVYGYSEIVATRYFRVLQQKVYASSGVDIPDFAALALPSVADADEININYLNGTVQKMNRLDLRVNRAFSRQINNDAFDYQIENRRSTPINFVNFIPAADQQIYVAKWYDVTI